MEFPQLRAEVLTAVATGVQVTDGELPFSALFMPTKMNVRGDVAKWDEKLPIRTLDNSFEGRESPATTTDSGTVKPRAVGMYTSFKKRVVKPEVLDQLRAVGGPAGQVASAEQSLALMVGDMMRRHYWEKMEYLIVSALLNTQSVTVNGATVAPDFGLAVSHNITVGTSWATASTDIDGDMEAIKRVVAEDSGRAVRRVLAGRNIPGYLRKNTAVKGWFQAREGAPGFFNSMLGESFSNLLGLDWSVMRHGYVSGGSWTPYLGDDKIVVIPEISQEWFQIHLGSVKYPSTVYGSVSDFNETFGVAAWSRLKDNPPAAWYFQRWAGLAVPVFPSAYLVADVTP